MGNLIRKTSRRWFDFDIFYNKLIKFKDEYHHVNVPFNYVSKDGYKLGRSVSRIRSGEIKTSDIQKQKLDEIGFVWNAKKVFDFDLFYSELIKFRDMYHHVKVPRSYTTSDGYKLGTKVQHIRSGNIKSTETQKKKLDEIGFVWDATIQFDFDLFYSELIKFKNTHHHLKVLYNYVTEKGYKLSAIVHSVRSGHIKLTKIQREKLDEIGFIWDARTIFDFNLFYNELIKYKNTYHHLKIQQNYATDDGYKLGMKVQHIRSGHIKLSETQKQKLDEIGFIWAVHRKSKIRNMDFNKVYTQLVNYKNQFHNLYVPYDYVVDNLELGLYVRNIRNLDIELSEDERLSLINLGFEFNTHNSLYPNIEYSIDDDTSLLITNMLNGDMCARYTLVAKYLRFAENIVSKYFPYINNNDIHDVAYESLISCIDKLDETTGFSHYLYTMIKGFALNYLKQRKKFVSLYSTKFSNSDLTIKYIDAIKDRNVTPETMDNNIFQAQLSAKLKSTLTKQEYHIICLFSGLNKDNTNYSVSDIAKFFNTDKEYIENEIARILNYLNNKLAEAEWNI